MTTPQPAALPEHSAAIEQLKMAAANFENAASVPNVPNAGDYAQKAREIRASIAALQSQPAAAGVSDAACVPEKPLGTNWHAHYVLLDKAALQMIRNALRNDVERGLKVRGEMLDELDRAILALRPQAVPMTEADLLKCLIEANCLGPVHMSHEHGPYYIDRPSHAAVRLKDAIEAHHGITAPAGGEKQA